MLPAIFKNKNLTELALQRIPLTNDILDMLVLYLGGQSNIKSLTLSENEINDALF